MEEAVAATLVEAMYHAQQCLMLITATQERPGIYCGVPYLANPASGPSQ
jgi:hypothetical protein